MTESTGDKVHASENITMFRCAQSLGAQDAQTVGIVQNHDGFIVLGKGDDFLKRGDFAVVWGHPLENDPAKPGVGGALELVFEPLEIFGFKQDLMGRAQSNAVNK